MASEDFAQFGIFSEDDIGTMVPGVSTDDLFARMRQEIDEMGGEILNKEPAIIGQDWKVMFGYFPEEYEFTFIFSVHNEEKESFLSFSDTDLFCPDLLKDMAYAMLNAKKMLETKKVN